MDTPGLDRARNDVAAAAARLGRLKRSACAPPGEAPRVERWRELRSVVEGLLERLSAWTRGAPRDDVAGHEAGRRAELEESSLRAEASLARAAGLQREADDLREEALAELERTREGWRLLRAEARAAGLSPAETDIAGALMRVQEALVAGERALDEERRAQREAQGAARAWRWLVDVVLPAFEGRAVAADGMLLLPTLRRLVQELDEHWTRELDAARQRLALDPSGAARDERAAERSARLAAAQGDEAVRAERLQELERVTAVWKAEVAALQEALELQRNGAGPELGRLRERLVYERQRANAFAARFKFAAEEVAKLRAELARPSGPEPGGYPPLPGESGASPPAS